MAAAGHWGNSQMQVPEVTLHSVYMADTGAVEASAVAAGQAVGILAVVGREVRMVERAIEREEGMMELGESHLVRNSNYHPTTPRASMQRQL